MLIHLLPAPVLAGVFFLMPALLLAQPRQDVRQRYPGATRLVETRTEQAIYFTFLQDQHLSRAIYDTAGHWLGTISPVALAELPAALAAAAPHSHLAYRIESRFTYAPLYALYQPPQGDPPPPHGILGIIVAEATQLQPYLVDRHGSPLLSPERAHFQGLLYHPSGREVASLQLDLLLRVGLIPYPRAWSGPAVPPSPAMAAHTGWHRGPAW